jgi:proteasome alpha subunit
MKDRSEYARKGIARGKSVVVLEYAGGVLFLAENASTTLHKISEIYDRIAFAGVGKYSEFEELRIAGVQHADGRGYVYGRDDVRAKALANAYSQALSGIFTQSMKPYEVEVLVAEVGETDGAKNELYHVLFDGSVTDEQGSVGIGGQAEELTRHLEEAYAEGWDLATAVKKAVDALSAVEAREIPPNQIEAAVLDRTRKPARKFRRLDGAEIGSSLGIG